MADGEVDVEWQRHLSYNGENVYHFFKKEQHPMINAWRKTNYFSMTVHEYKDGVLQGEETKIRFSVRFPMKTPTNVDEWLKAFDDYYKQLPPRRNLKTMEEREQNRDTGTFTQTNGNLLTIRRKLEFCWKHSTPGMKTFDLGELWKKENRRMFRSAKVNAVEEATLDSAAESAQMKKKKEQEKHDTADAVQMAVQQNHAERLDELAEADDDDDYDYDDDEDGDPTADVDDDSLGSEYDAEDGDDVDPEDFASVIDSDDDAVTVAGSEVGCDPDDDDDKVSRLVQEAEAKKQEANALQLKAEDEAVAASAAEAAEAQRLEEVMAARLEFAAAETAETEATKAAKAAEEAVLNSAAAVETAKGECKKVTDAWVNGGCSSTMKLAVEDAAANVTKKQYAADKADEARRTATRFAEEQKESRVLAQKAFDAAAAARQAAEEATRVAVDLATAAGLVAAAAAEEARLAEAAAAKATKEAAAAKAAAEQAAKIAEAAEVARVAAREAARAKARVAAQAEERQAAEAAARQAAEAAARQAAEAAARQAAGKNAFEVMQKEAKRKHQPGIQSVLQKPAKTARADMDSPEVENREVILLEAEDDLDASEDPELLKKMESDLNVFKESMRQEERDQNKNLHVDVKPVALLEVPDYANLKGVIRTWMVEKMLDKEFATMSEGVYQFHPCKHYYEPRDDGRGYKPIHIKCKTTGALVPLRAVDHILTKKWGFFDHPRFYVVTHTRVNSHMNDNRPPEYRIAYGIPRHVVVKLKHHVDKFKQIVKGVVGHYLENMEDVPNPCV